jgi:Pectate lyase superfamily protein
VNMVIRHSSIKRGTFALILALLFATSTARATSVSGRLVDITGTPVSSAGALVRVTLLNYGSNLPKVTGSYTIATPKIDLTPDAAGNFSGTLTGNDQISPSGTFYRFCVISGGAQFRCADFEITGSTWDLNSATPLSTSPAVTAPTGDTTYLRTDGGNKPTGNIIPDVDSTQTVGNASARWEIYGDAVDANSMTLVGNITAPIVDKGGEVFNVKAYGALGDGTTDDSTAFQSAWTAVSANGGVLYIPQTSSCYLIDTTLNFTGIGGHRITILGAGGVGPGSGSNALICGNTGRAVFDITMSYNLTFENVDVTAQKPGLSNPSLIGILAGRNASGQSGQHNRFINCNFQLPLHTSGTTYSFGVYFYGEELQYFWGDTFNADCGMFIGSSNIYSVSSPYVTFGTLTTYSETAVLIDDVDFYSNGLLPAIYLFGAYDIKISGGHVYNGSQGAGYSGSLYQYAIYAGSNTYQPNHDISILNFRNEGYPGFIYIDQGLKSSVIQGTHTPSPSPMLHAVEFNGASASIQGVDFEIFDESTSASQYYYDATAGSPAGVWSIDSVSFYCGAEPKCLDIPIGQGSGSGSAYWHNISWSRSSATSPSLLLSPNAIALPLTGGFTIPTTSVPANSCTSLSAVSASGGPAVAYVEVHPQMWYGLMITAAFGTGTIIPQVCNITASPISPGSTIGATFRIVQ